MSSSKRGRFLYQLIGARMPVALTASLYFFGSVKLGDGRFASAKLAIGVESFGITMGNTCFASKPSCDVVYTKSEM